MDDAAVVRSSLVALLHGGDVEVVAQSETLAQAICDCRQFKPDVITLDLRLSDGNGMDLLDLLQRECLPTAVIVLTSYPYLQYDK